MRITISEQIYAPGLVQQRHAHAESSITLVIGGALEEQVGRTHEYARPLSVVIKPSDTEHANKVSSAGARTLQLVLPVGSLPDEMEVLGGWRWMHAAAVTKPFLRVLAAFRSQSVLLQDEILDLLVALRPIGLRNSSAAPVWLQKVRERIDDEIPNVPRVQELARSANVHPVYLARQFRRFYACSVTDYVAGRRSQIAAALLTSEEFALSSIAYRAGYADQSHFCRAFKAMTGITPGSYRGLSGVVSSVQYSNLDAG